MYYPTIDIKNNKMFVEDRNGKVIYSKDIPIPAETREKILAHPENNAVWQAVFNIATFENQRLAR